MQHNINLYDARFLKKRDWLAGQSVALLMLLSILLVTVGAGAARWVLAEQELQARTAGLQLQQARSAFAELTRLLSGRKQDPALVSEIASLQRDIGLSRETETILQGMAGGNQQARLGEMLKVLARVNVDGMWLTGLTVADGGRDLEIRGRVLDQSLLPAYLRRLEGEPAFRGRRFAALEMRGTQWEPPGEPVATVNRPERQESKRDRWYVDFALHTTPPATNDETSNKAVVPVRMPVDSKLIEAARKGVGL